MLRLVTTVYSIITSVYYMVLFAAVIFPPSRWWYRWITPPNSPTNRASPQTIQYAVWVYYRFNLSYRDIEDLLAQRGIIVTHESIRLWCNKYGPKYAARLRKKHQGYGHTFYIDEVLIKILGKQQYLWRAIGQDGEVVDIFMQKLIQVLPAPRINCL